MFSTNGIKESQDQRDVKQRQSLYYGWVGKGNLTLLAQASTFQVLYHPVFPALCLYAFPQDVFQPDPYARAFLPLWYDLQNFIWHAYSHYFINSYLCFKDYLQEAFLTVQSLSNLCLFISKPNHSLDIAMCSLSLVTNASCLYSKFPQIDRASLANKNGVFSSFLPRPSPCSLSPKTQDIPKPSFVCCNTQNAPPWWAWEVPFPSNPSASSTHWLS